MSFLGWVETRPSNICIFPTDIHFYRLMALCDTDVHRENTDVRWFGFHPLMFFHFSLWHILPIFFQKPLTEQ